MKDILEKLTSYNLFNYLLPGVIFAVIAEHMTGFSFKQQDIIIGAFVYYFIGLVISRVGSLVVEPTLKWVRFVRFAEYKDFVAAARSDTRLEALSEQNNSYRTLFSTFLLLLVLKLYDRLSTSLPVMTKHQNTILLATLSVMFLFAYRKQSSYITRRVTAAQATTADAKGKAATA